MRIKTILAAGVGAAALLFGGSASNYAISTVDNNPLNINFQAHYEVAGSGSAIFADTFLRAGEGVTRYQDNYTGDPATSTSRPMSATSATPASTMPSPSQPCPSRRAGRC